MKTTSFIIAVLLIVSIAMADELALVETIAAPDSKIVGLAWDSDYLWMSYGDNASIYKGMIVKIDMTGNLITSFVAPGDIGYHDVPDTAGLAFDGTWLWSINSGDDTIYKLTKSGEVISSIPTPGKYCYSLTWDGANLWINNTDNGKIYKINPSNGEIVPKVALSFQDGRGVERRCQRHFC